MKHNFIKSTSDETTQVGATPPYISDPLSDPIRESMQEDLPEWMQSFLTWLTAKPYRGQTPFHCSPIGLLWSACWAIAFGYLLCGWAIAQGSGWLLLIPAGWSLTLYGTRMLRLTIQHACAHRAVFGDRQANTWLGETISILTLTRSFPTYQRSHLKTHHTAVLLQPGDETYEYLINTVGFRPDMTVRQLWQHLWKTLLSPEFHHRVFAGRFKACFLSPCPRHNLLARTSWLAILGLITFTHSWTTFLVAWGIPITVLFQASSCLRQCVEHRWPASNSDLHPYAKLNQMTAAIFLGEPTPSHESSNSKVDQWLAWSRWTLRMLFYHLPARTLVLSGDSPCHDYHHRHPGAKDWANCIFARQKDLEAGLQKGEAPYLGTWGLFEAINETFNSLQHMSHVSGFQEYLLEDYRQQKNRQDDCLGQGKKHSAMSLTARLTKMLFGKEGTKS